MTNDNPFGIFDSSKEDWAALWLPMFGAALSVGAGIVAVAHHDCWTGIFSISAALVTAGGVLATGAASKKRDEQLAFWVQQIDTIDRRTGDGF